MDYIDQITLDDLDEEKQQLAELIGIENYRKILRVFPGADLYVPKMEELKIMFRNAAIRRAFDGKNYKQLAAQFDLSERTIRGIVSGEKRKLKLVPPEGQLKLDL